MKKLIALLMSSVLLFSLVACSGNTDTDKDKDKDNDKEKTSAVENEDADVSEDNSQTVSRGTIVGNRYTNDFAGISFEKPDDWNYMDDEDLIQLVNAGMSIMDLNELQETLTKQASVYDMAAVDPTGGNSVMVLYENTMLTAYREISADEYIDALKTQLASVAALEYDLGEAEDVTLGNTQFKKLTATAAVTGVELTQIYYIRECGKYIVGVIATAYNTPVETIEAMFN